jgi:16S rRNA (cytosine1402-N4)-methyltransferase
MAHSADEPNAHEHAWQHTPVLQADVMALLALPPGAAWIDMTLGLGGHAAALLAATAPSGRLLAVDRDAAALALAQRRLADAAARVRFVHDAFSAVASVAVREGFTQVDAILFDLGVSSMQLDDAERGFSCTVDGPLDMRMNAGIGRTAAEIVNGAPVAELTRLLREYGGEPLAAPVARAIARRRERALFNRTGDLARLVSGVYRARGWRRSRLHPATRVFQALRIAVNDEIVELQAGLAGAWDVLRDGGRLAVISFHSGEDKLVKEFMKAKVNSGAGRMLTKKPVTAGAAECADNPRARSAKLRVCQRGEAA